MRGIAIGLFVAAMMGSAQAEPMKLDTFAFAAPSSAETGTSLQLYSTFYHVWPGAETAAGTPLLLKTGASSGLRVGKKDWCFGAMEGTIVVKKLDGTRVTLNFADKGGPFQVDCRPFFSSVSQSVINGMARTRYTEVGSQAPFGLGVGGFRLVPYRTIAVDPSVIPFGTLIFIPALAGKSFTDPDGVARTHDGYVYAADRGGLITGRHVDFFSGVQQTNPFPSIIKSVPTGTFEARIVTGGAARDFLRAQHALN